MKKLFMIAAAALSLAMASCGESVESKAENYAKETIEALKAGDLKKTKEIGKEADKWMETLSDEDKKKAEEASENYLKEHEKEVVEAMEKSIGGLLPMF